MGVHCIIIIVAVVFIIIVPIIVVIIVHGLSSTARPMGACSICCHHCLPVIIAVVIGKNGDIYVDGPAVLSTNGNYTYTYITSYI
jgi:hypothetical protein